MTLPQREFDNRVSYINTNLEMLRNWKHIFLGAAYTTRLKLLSKELKLLTAYIDRLVEDDSK